MYISLDDVLFKETAAILLAQNITYFFCRILIKAAINHGKIMYVYATRILYDSWRLTVLFFHGGEIGSQLVKAPLAAATST